MCQRKKGNFLRDKFLLSNNFLDIFRVSSFFSFSSTFNFESQCLFSFAFLFLRVFRVFRVFVFSSFRILIPSPFRTNMKTEGKALVNLTKVKIAVLGNVNVGKSALTVRYLTRRFIGEYRSNTDLLYRQKVTINNIQSEVEIIDVSGETRDSPFPMEHVQWADACVVVYSITDKDSFRFAAEALQNLQKFRPVPVTLLANKVDLEHLREVDEIKGRRIALQNGCPFYEISVAENSPDLYQAFEFLVNECRCLQQNTSSKSRKFSVTKMIGTLIGGNGRTVQSIPAQGGTVVVCSKNDLHRNRVLKRRQNFTATASL